MADFYDLSRPPQAYVSIIVPTDDKYEQFAPQWQTQSDCPRSGIIRWAAGIEFNKDRPLSISANGSLWSDDGSTITGVTHDSEFLYFISFSPMDHLIRWKRINADNVDEIADESNQLHMSLSLIKMHEETYKDRRSKDASACDGYIQNQFISAIIVSLIAKAANIDNEDDDGGTEGYNPIRDFFKGYQFPKVEAIKKMVVDNLTQFNKSSISSFVAVLAMMDKTLEWSKSDGKDGCYESHRTEIRLRGAPGYTFQDRNTYVYCICYNDQSTFRVDDIDYRYNYRGLFRQIQGMFDDDTKSNTNMHADR